MKEKYNQYNDLVTEKEDLELLLEMVKEENDEELAKELNSKISPFLDKLDQYELDLLLSDPYDKNNAIIELHPGAGGTESQDWGSLLLRMYTRWAEKEDLKLKRSIINLVMKQVSRVLRCLSKE